MKVLELFGYNRTHLINRRSLAPKGRKSEKFSKDSQAECRTSGILCGNLPDKSSVDKAPFVLRVLPPKGELSVCCRDFLPNNAPKSAAFTAATFGLSKTCSKLGRLCRKLVRNGVLRFRLTSSRASDANFSLVRPILPAPLLFCISAEGLINFRNSEYRLLGSRKTARFR